MGGRVLWSVNSELRAHSGIYRQALHGGIQPGTRRRRGSHLDPDHRPRHLDSTTGRWRAAGNSSWGATPRWNGPAGMGPTLRELARQLRARGITQLEGALALTSRTGPAASRYPAVWSAEFVGQLYAPPVGPVTLHENTISLTFRPGRDVGCASHPGISLPCRSRPAGANERHNRGRQPPASGTDGRPRWRVDPGRNHRDWLAV